VSESTRRQLAFTLHLRELSSTTAEVHLELCASSASATVRQPNSSVAIGSSSATAQRVPSLQSEREHNGSTGTGQGGGARVQRPGELSASSAGGQWEHTTAAGRCRRCHSGCRGDRHRQGCCQRTALDQRELSGPENSAQGVTAPSPGPRQLNGSSEGAPPPDSAGGRGPLLAAPAER